MRKIFSVRNFINLALFGGTTFGGLYATDQLENAVCLAGGLGRAARGLAYGIDITINYFRVIIC
jgi:hypothetical protein